MAWDSICLGEVSSICSQSCAPVPQEIIQYGVNDHLAVRTFPVGSDGYNAGESSRAYGGDEATWVTHVDGSVDTYFHVPIGRGRSVDLWTTNSQPGGSPTSGITYLHRDRLGSVIAVSKPGATTAAVQWRYLPYGAVDTTSGSETADARSDWGYTGALKLGGGLLWMRARVYDPSSKRFLQADDVDSKRYSYADGDPTNQFDPTGHASAHVSPDAYWFLQAFRDFLDDGGARFAGITGGSDAGDSQLSGGAAFDLISGTVGDGLSAGAQVLADNPKLAASIAAGLGLVGIAATIAITAPEATTTVAGGLVATTAVGAGPIAVAVAADLPEVEAEIESLAAQAEPAAAAAADGTMTLFRGMNSAEAQSLLSGQGFSTVPGANAVKWFAQNAAHAAEWGARLTGPGYQVLGFEFPSTIETYFRPLLDGIGPAHAIELEVLQALPSIRIWLENFGE